MLVVAFLMLISAVLMYDAEHEAQPEVFREQALEMRLQKIAMPKLGCGLDKLQWADVREAIKDTFNDTEIEILVCYI